MRLVLIRHGPTEWNAEKRLQGRTDIPLSADGEADVRRWSLPADLAEMRWFTSPLMRARRTAELLGVAAEPATAAIEMDFGTWEGRRLADLRAEDPAAVAANEARGLDFRPPGGESPRDVQSRIAGWLADLADDPVASRRGTGVVTHKGVTRAALSLATGWPMLGRPPVRLDWSAAHLFDVGSTGALSLVRANLPLISTPEEAGPKEIDR